MSYHLPNVGEEAIPEVLCGLDGQLGGQVVNGAHEDAISFNTETTEFELPSFNNFSVKTVYKKNLHFKYPVYVFLVPVFYGTKYNTNSKNLKTISSAI